MSDKTPKEFSRLANQLIGDFRNIPDETPASMRKRPTKPIAELVEKLLVKYQIGRDAPEHTIREQWPLIVGRPNAQYSHPVQIDPKGRLLVLTSHAVVRNELFHHRKIIVDKIKKIPGCDHVRELTIRAG